MKFCISVDKDIDSIVSRFALATGLSKSAIYSFAITCLCTQYNIYEENSKESEFFDFIRHFYKNYFIKKNPRGFNK